MTIKAKLLSSFVVMIGVFGALSVYLVYLLDKQGDQTIYAFNQPLKAVTSSQNASNTFAKAASLAQSVLAMTMPSESMETLKEFRAVRNDFNKQLGDASENSLTDDAKSFSQSIEGKASQWFSETEKYLSGDSQSQLLDLRVLDTVRLEIESMLAEFATKTSSDAEHIADDVEHDTRQQVIGSIITLLIFAAGAAFASLYLTRNILKPVNELRLAAIELSRGDGDLTRRLESKNNDEVGELSNELNSFITKVHVTVEQIAKSVKESHQYLGEFVSISEFTQQGTEKQKAEIGLIGQSIEDVIALGEKVNSSSHSAQQQSNRIYEETKEGVGLVQKNNEGMESLTDKLNKASDVIFELSNASAEINSVLDVIELIANQTNLLSLNAAIEAARAGEAGRGFSVVAEEVRNLALKTQESTVTIQDTITNIQALAQDAKSMMEVGRDEAEVCRTMNLTLSESMTDVLANVEQIQSINKEVSGYTERQENTVNQVNAYLSQIITVADETAVGSLKLMDNSNSVLNAIKHVDDNVAAFKL
ncbi:methyl-accepting chemotaxis protein [Alteromonadaceae bacterium M269]|nr:methyl-accepting chemotaxis protein [Alteromonadaceae bacterium M269]